MESDKMTTKDMKVEIGCRSEVVSGTIGVEFEGALRVGQSGLVRQTSMTKTSCLCSPTTHAGSFRCRLHRIHSLHRTKSMESQSLRDQACSVHVSIVDAAGDPNKDRIH